MGFYVALATHYSKWRRCW